MTTATDAGVRSGKTSSEMIIFVLCGVMMVLNGTVYVDIPWEQMNTWLTVGGMGMGGRILQKTVATYTTGKSLSESVLVNRLRKLVASPATPDKE